MDKRAFDPGQRIDVLRDDLTDVSVYLQNQYSAERYFFSVDYYHHQKFFKEIAYVVVIGPAQEKRRAIRATASQALLAIGWQIIPEGGGDVIDTQPHPTLDRSAHDRLRAISRIKNALDQAKRFD
jgi:hypothetical protein